jgi:hypothetical protein
MVWLTLNFLAPWYPVLSGPLSKPLYQLKPSSFPPGTKVMGGGGEGGFQGVGMGGGRRRRLKRDGGGGRGGNDSSVYWDMQLYPASSSLAVQKNKIWRFTVHEIRT